MDSSKKLVINSSSQSSLCLWSYNSRGFCTSKQEFCNFLVSACGSSIPIICNQENFLLKSNSWKINNTLPGFRIFVKPAVKVNEDYGRHRNGMFIAIPQNLNIDIEDVSPDNWRVFKRLF